MKTLTRQRDERSLKARRTGLWGVIYQGVYAVAQLVSLGMLARHVGEEQYGLWMTILAASTWMTLANLGQTSSILTKLGAVALTNRVVAERVFSANVFLVGAFSTVLILSLLLVGPVLPWCRLLSAESIGMTDSEVGAVTMGALAVSALAVPAGLASFSVLAHQRGDLAHIIMSSGSLVSLAATGIAIRGNQPLWLAGTISLSGPLLGGVALWIIGLGNGLVPRPQRGLVDRTTFSETIRAGFMFLLIDATTLMLLRTPDLLVAHLYGVDAVGRFASVGRLPLLMIAVFQALLLPFWPALVEAAHRGDREWVRQTVIRTLAIVLGVWLAGATGIWLLGEYFVRLWTGTANFATSDLIAAACAQSLGLGLFSWLSVVLSALSQKRLLVVTSVLASLIFLPLAAFLGSKFGPVGVALAQAGTLLSCSIPLGGLVLRRKLVWPCTEHQAR